MPSLRCSSIALATFLRGRERGCEHNFKGKPIVDDSLWKFSIADNIQGMRLDARLARQGKLEYAEIERQLLREWIAQTLYSSYQSNWTN